MIVTLPKHWLAILGVLAGMYPSWASAQLMSMAETDTGYLQWYDHTVGKDHSGLMKGREYKMSFRGLKTHPFLAQTDPFLADITFRSQRYVSVPVHYDIFTDDVLLEGQTANSLPALIKLSKTEVSRFTLDGRAFRHQQVTDSIALGVVSGYFEVLASSNQFDFVVRRRKTRDVVNQRLEYKEEHLYFISMADELFPVRTIKQYYQLFPDNREAIKQFVKSNELKINVRHEQAMVQLAQFCQGL